MAEWRRSLLAILLGTALLPAACSTASHAPPSSSPAASPAQPTPPVALPLQQGVAELATAMVKHAQLPPPPPSGRYRITIDPWIDAATGDQVATTRLMQAEIETLAPQHFPQLELLPFTTRSLARKPLVLLGAITPVTAPGSTAPDPDHPGAYRVYGVLADLATGRIAAAESVWVRPQDVDVTPTPFYRDSPVRVPDSSVTAYLRTAASRPGDPIDPAYLQNLQAEALLADAGSAYDRGDYAAARVLYREAAGLPEGGHQVRIYDGLYLTDWALGDHRQAAKSFARLVQYGLTHDYLGVKFLFQVGSTEFWPDQAISGAYPMWLRTIARQAADQGACLQIIGHASPPGSPTLNDRLSLARARRIQGDLVDIDPALRGRLEVEGVGARDPLVPGDNEAADLLDRRVDFQPIPCSRVTASAKKGGAGEGSD